jgi:hypothetical protein
MIYWAEKYGPIALAFATAGALLYFSEEMVGLAADKSINVSALYSAIFNWASIQTGFLFGVFGFVSGKSSGFLAEINRTQAMQTFNIYTRNATLLGFLVALTCIPLVVTDFDISAKSAAHYYVFVGWSFVTVWSFLAFARVAYVFGVILQVRDKTKILG